MIRVKPLTDDLIESFDKHLREDPFTNIFFILDLHDPRERKRSEFYLALEDDEIKGKLLVYHAVRIPSVWIRGSEEAASSLLEAAELPDPAVFHADRELSDLIKRKVSVRAEYPTEIMVARRGDHKSFIKHDVEELGEEHAIDVLTLFREFQPSLGPIKDEEIMEFRKGLERRTVYGIFVEGKLVSTTAVARFATLENIRWIFLTFTKQECRGRGFATSLVSRAVSGAFQNPEVEYVGLVVRSTNVPAKRVYGKVGFKKHRELTWLSVNTDLAP